MQRQVHNLVLVNLNRNLLSPGEHIVRSIGFPLREQWRLMSSRNYPQAAIFRRTLGERDPRGRSIGRGETPVSCVLVPGDKRAVSGKLGEPMRVPNHDVGA